MKTGIRAIDLLTCAPHHMLIKGADQVLQFLDYMIQTLVSCTTDNFEKKVMRIRWDFMIDIIYTSVPNSPKFVLAFNLYVVLQRDLVGMGII